MSKTLTTNELQWDARPFSLTLAGCLALAGMPLDTVPTSDTAGFTPKGTISYPATEEEPQPKKRIQRFVRRRAA